MIPFPVLPDREIKQIGCAFLILFGLAPFGVWKIVELIIWVFENVRVSIG